jgi:hypothetical protein
MPLIRRSNDPAVCGWCGTPTDGAGKCSGCGRDLTRFEKLPLRSEWARNQGIESQTVEEPVEATTAHYELNPVALAAALLGAGMCVVGLFLPATENPGFSQVESNSLIQQGTVVWIIVIFGAIFAVDLARAYQAKRPPSWWELIFPISVGISSGRLLKGDTRPAQASTSCSRAPCYADSASSHYERRLGVR